MNNYSRFKAFTQASARDIPELDARLVTLSHNKTKCKLYILERDDTNKTFCIGFRTVPTDDTGIFHILEHSVLAGSKKFPLKDPFSELIKGSVSTYINAMTFEEKTLYPVSSKNDKAFLGLVDVYLDAVLHPLALENRFIFMQEGHRYEIDENGNLTVNGIVYNEMKAAYASADDYANYLMSKLTDGNGTYSYDSGGHPDSIPKLTYEDFKAGHAKFYHPTNAYIFLDGNVNYDEIIPLISEYLEPYDRLDKPIPEIDASSPMITDTAYGTYPIDESEKDKDRTKIYLGYKSFSCRDRLKNNALRLICEAIAESNTSVLTKKILDTGLCKSMYFYARSSSYSNLLNVTFADVKDGKENELMAAFDRALAEILSAGIPNDSIEAALVRQDLLYRLADFGSFPAGVNYAIAVLEAVIFEIEPETKLIYREMIDELRSRLGTSYYTDLLREVISAPRATLIMHPDKSFARKKDEEARLRLEEIKKSLTAGDIEEIKRTSAAFDEWQQAPDTDEAYAALPLIKLEDLNPEPEITPTRVTKIGNTELINHPLKTKGVYHTSLLFDASDATEEEIHYIALYDSLIQEWDTEKYTSEEFYNKIKLATAGLANYEKPIKRGDDAKLYIKIKFTCLESKAEEACAILEEHIYKRRLNDREILLRNLYQMSSRAAEAIASRGDSYARMRNAAKYSAFERLSEMTGGYEFLSFIKDTVHVAEKDSDSIFRKLEEIRDKFFRLERLTISVTGENPEVMATPLLSIIKDGGTQSGECRIKPLEKINEGIAVAANVSCAAVGSNLHELGENKYTGSFSVLSNILSNEILWNEIRVKGGAYGTGYTTRANSGTVLEYSYADPTPERTVDIFKNVAVKIREFLDTDPDLDRYIIGTIGNEDTVSNPRIDGDIATVNYLSGICDDALRRFRKEAVETTRDDLYALADILKEVMKSATYTVVGPRSMLEADKNIQAVLELS